MRRRKRKSDGLNPEQYHPLAKNHTKTQLAYRFPFKQRVVEHVMIDSRRFANLAIVLLAMGLKIYVAPNAWDFDIVPV